MSDGVAIAILTYRRPAYLERALASACAQRGDVREVMVVDNAADEEVRLWVRERFPGVRYLAMPYNGGCDGRNMALRETHCGIVINVDDDVELVGSDCAIRVADAFAGDRSLACLNFKIVDAGGKVREREWCHPRPISEASCEFETCYILEGESALRREAVLEAGGYSRRLFLYHEGLDLAFRLIDRGFRIIYSPTVAVVHHAAPDAERAARFYYCSVRNGIWIAYQYLPLGEAVADVAAHIAKMTFFAARAGQLKAHWRGCADAIRGLPSIKRTPIRPHTRERLRAIRAERSPLTARISRHLRERIL